MAKRAHPIREAAHRSRSPNPTSEPGMCLRETRECFEVPARYGTAAEAWRNAKHKHKIPSSTVIELNKIPIGVPIFWTGGSEGYGHVAISAVKRGYCWSTDILRPGYFDRVPITLIASKWGLTLAGWTEDLNGVRVYPNTK